MIATVLLSTVLTAESSLIHLKEDTLVVHNYRFVSGEQLDSVKLHYRTLGTPRRDAKGNIANAVLFLHWTGASGIELLATLFSQVLFGPGQALDLEKYFLIVPDNLGHGQSSKPSDGLGRRFPHYRFADMVSLQHRLVTDRLNISRLHSIVGLSIGGMHAWMWGEQYPEAVESLIPIVAQPAPISGRNLLWRRVIAQAIRTDPAWEKGLPLHRWPATFPLMLLMAEGVGQLETAITNSSDALQFIQTANKAALSKNAIDMVYALEASDDYNPQHLERISARVFALNFADDEFNPVELGVLPAAMNRVKQGSFLMVPSSAETHGHSSQMRPHLWAPFVARSLAQLRKP